MRIGTNELLIILVVVLLIFGPKNLPKLGKMFGFYSCLELRMPFCFYNRITNTVDNIVGTINGSLQYSYSIILCLNSLQKVLMDFQQYLFCLMYFYK